MTINERAAHYNAQDRERAAAAAAGISPEDYVTLCAEQCRVNLAGGSRPPVEVTRETELAELQRLLGVSAKEVPR